MLARDEKSSDDDPSIDPVIRQGMAESASAVQWDRQADVAQLRSGDEMQHRRAPRRILLFVAFLALLAVAGLASSAGESGSTPVTVQAATFPTGIGDVWVIVMENTNWSTIFQNTASAPYINSLLARSDAAYATQYYNPAG